MRSIYIKLWPVMNLNGGPKHMDMLCSVYYVVYTPV